jgi:gluconolactonase
MELRTCSHHAEPSEPARHPIHQKEHRMSDVTMFATGLGFPEGPVVRHDGSVVRTNIRHGRSTRVFPDGSTRVFSHTGGGPNGLASGPDGAFYLCNNGASGATLV